MTAAVEVGQIRQNPDDDAFVVVVRPAWMINGRAGWAARPIDHLGRPTGEPTRWIGDINLSHWALVPNATPTEPTQ